MKRHALTIVVAAILAVVLVLYLIGFQVRETQIAVVTTFGKPSSTKDRPGLYWKWPWPIQKVYLLDGRMHVFEGTYDELLTRDGQNITVTACVGWRIKDGLKFIASVGSIEAAEPNLESLVRNQKMAVLGRYDLKNLVSTDPNEMQFDKVEADLIMPVKQVAMEKYGVEVLFARIKRLSLPASVTSSVFERMKQEREREVKRYRGDGEGRASEIKKEAEAARKKILARAEAEARIIRAEGEAAAAEYLKVLGQNPQLALFLRMVDALKKLKERTTLVLDSNTPPYSLLQINNDGKAILSQPLPEAEPQKSRD